MTYQLIVLDIIAFGTLAFDTIETPFGKVERVIGGSCSHFQEYPLNLQ